MFKYYQTKEKGTWIPVEFTSDTESVVRGQGAKRLTILAVSELVDDEATDKHKLSYKGPLYFDIDCKNLNEAIESCRKLVQHLIKLGTPKESVQVYCSGSKGMHVIVDEKCFSTGRATRSLPLIYKEMASSLYVPGMDFQVYSQGRGVCWRLVNVQRDDGKYRIRISVEELATLTEEAYRTLCAAPREIAFPEPVAAIVPELQLLFEAAKKRVAAKPASVVIASDADLKKISEVPPVCVTELASYKGLHADKNFNQAAMQMAIYIARAGVSQEMADSLLDLMATNSHSTKYDTAKSRKEHLQGQLAYIRSSQQYKFGCNAMRGMLKTRPCEGCPIETEGDGIKDEAAEVGIKKLQDGYYIQGPKEDRKISNFTLVPLDVFMEIPQDGSTPRRKGTIVDIVRGGNRVATTVIDEGSWNSVSAFKREVEGISNLIFLGSDHDVHRIKLLTYEEGQDMGQIMQVYTCGIHTHEIDGTTIFTYVEPGLSINNMKVTGTHRLQGKAIAPPYFNSTEVCKAGDAAAEKALVNLMKVCGPRQSATIVGWFVACHLKAHFKHLFGQFPILHVWGNAGSGKSKTVELVSNLNGTDFGGKDTAVNASSLTNWATIDYFAGTTTVPRVLEEFNRSKIKNEKSYVFIGEMLKASWNSESILRGTIGGKNSGGRTGAATVEIPIVSPIVVIGEQGFEMPALLERSVEVMLSKNTREGRAGNYAEASAGRNHLRSIGKALMIKSLMTNLESVEDMMHEADNVVPSNIDDRPRYSLKVIYIGLWYLRKLITEDLKFSDEARITLDLLINQFVEYVQMVGRNALSATAHSEVDAVIETMALMAAMSNGSTSSNAMTLERGVHYMVVDDTLFLDIPICHAIYRRYAANVEKIVPAIANAKQFKILLAEEYYYVGETTVGTHFASNRPVSKLSIARMAEKGIDTSLFMME